jgi:molecular chaperone DnaK
MGKAIGIDLGTTNTAVAVLVDGRPRVLEDERGYKVLPSCVSMKDDGQFVVGQAARNLAITRPDRTVYAVKRLAGRRHDSAEAVQIRSRVSYGVGPDEDGGCLVQIGDDWYTPTEVQAVILQVARSIAERALDEEVDEAVITVPAYFNHQQRSATLEAAKMAGLRCERLLNEPTAAALAYGHRKDIDRTIVVYDLGGGTFDVSVLHLSKGVYEVLSTAGETYLGGEDFDYRLVDYLADHFGNEHGVDLREEPQPLQRLKEAAERAKCELSFTDRTTVLIPRITPTASLEVAVSRLTLEGLVEDLVERTLGIARGAVQDAGLQLSDIDDVILVGGQTRMPRVREAISALFQVEPSRSVHPEEVVAIGAAVHASSLTEADADRPLLLDVTPFDLGIDVAGGLFQPLISRNSHVPAAGTRVFATAHDNQDQVEVTVRQGDSRFAEENEFLGRFVMGGLTPAPRMQTKVEVTFRLDSNGMLHVSAVEQGTGERKQITIQNYAEVVQGGEARIEGDIDDGPGGGNAPVATDDKPKGGFFGRLFGRGKKKAAEASPAQKKRDRQAARPVGVTGGASSRPAPPPPPREPSLQPIDPSLQPVEPEPLPRDPSIQPVEPEPLPVDLSTLVDEEEPIALGGDDLLMLPDEDRPAQESGFGLDAEDELDAPLGFALGDVDEGDPFGDAGDDPFASGDDPFSSGDDPFSAAAPAPAPAAPEPEPEEVAFALPADDETDEVAFALPDDDEDEEDDDSEATAFAMPLEDEEAYREEENWDHSLQPLSEVAPEPAPAPAPPPEAPPAPRRKPRRRRRAKLKLAYPEPRAMVEEYRNNLRRGGCFVKTSKPLPVGRECDIEVRAPGLHDPIRIPGVVTWSSHDQATLPPGQSPGMGIEYRLDARGRASVEEALARLAPA